MSAADATELDFIPPSNTYGFDEMAVLSALFSRDYTASSLIPFDDAPGAQHIFYGYAEAVFDGSGNCIAILSRVSANTTQVSVYTGLNANTQKLKADLDKVMASIVLNRGKHTFAFSPVGYDGRLQGNEFFYQHPVMMNGVYVDDRDDVYVASGYFGGDLSDAFVNEVLRRQFFEAVFFSDYTGNAAFGIPYTAFSHKSRYQTLTTADPGMALQNPAYLTNPPAEKGIGVPSNSIHHYIYVFSPLRASIWGMSLCRRVRSMRHAAGLGRLFAPRVPLRLCRPLSEASPRPALLCPPPPVLRVRAYPAVRRAYYAHLFFCGKRGDARDDVRTSTQ